MIAALASPDCYPHAVSSVRTLETHISWVLLTGGIAYKIKKAVNLGFLNFTTLALRKHCCEEELRLNLRFAPDIYLDVVPICGTPDAPRMDGSGPVIEYAVRMREFPQDSLADALLRHGAFGPDEIDVLAIAVASFHSQAAPMPADSGLGSPRLVLQEAVQNFDQIGALDVDPATAQTLDELRDWTVNAHADCFEFMQRRSSGGWIRECHGDLHLGNIVVLDGRPVPFDCIEFNAEIRCIDVISEIAFLTMDLTGRGHPQLAARFLNRYLEQTGDYAGLRVLDFYQVYRALVRAKVHGLQARQRGISSDANGISGLRRYLELATRLIRPREPWLVITHGLSGSGKTTLSQALCESTGAVRIRSDIERKRLHGLSPLASSRSAPGAGIYSAEATASTYARLAGLAAQIVEAGYPAIVDAAFLMRAERKRFRDLASQLGIPCCIADLQVPEATLRARIGARQRQANDASEADMAVLEQQIAHRQPLTQSETGTAVMLDGALGDPGSWCAAVAGHLQQASGERARRQNRPPV